MMHRPRIFKIMFTNLNEYLKYVPVGYFPIQVLVFLSMCRLFMHLGEKSLRNQKTVLIL